MESFFYKMAPQEANFLVEMGDYQRLANEIFFRKIQKNGSAREIILVYFWMDVYNLLQESLHGWMIAEFGFLCNLCIHSRVLLDRKSYQKNVCKKRMTCET